MMMPTGPAAPHILATGPTPQVYDWNCSQKEIFDITAQPIVDSVMEGYNGEGRGGWASRGRMAAAIDAGSGMGR